MKKDKEEKGQGDNSKLCSLTVHQTGLEENAYGGRDGLGSHSIVKNDISRNQEPEVTP